MHTSEFPCQCSIALAAAIPHEGSIHPTQKQPKQVTEKGQDEKCDTTDQELSHDFFLLVSTH
jgi:hypothetical protein